MAGFEGVVFWAVVACLVLLVIVTGPLMDPAGRGLYALASLIAALCGTAVRRRLDRECGRDH